VTFDSEEATHIDTRRESKNAKKKGVNLHALGPTSQLLPKFLARMSLAIIHALQHRSDSNRWLSHRDVDSPVGCLEARWAREGRAVRALPEESSSLSGLHDLAGRVADFSQGAGAEGRQEESVDLHRVRYVCVVWCIESHLNCLDKMRRKKQRFDILI
jgi:hypothetical protein